jgi:uncharacterized membrane-anchored protein YitT (DUF2179 family)
MLKLILGCLVVSIGVLILHHSHLVTGGTAGLSLSLSYLVGMPFSVVFFLINIPFYILSLMRMGLQFTLSTLAAITILSFLTGLDQWLPDFSIPPLIGALAGGFIIGLGLALIFLNRSSLGGANILALYLQRRFGWDPGKTNFVFDFLVVASSFYSVGFWKGLYSVLSIYILAKVISLFKQQIAARNVSASVRPSTN